MPTLHAPNGSVAGSATVARARLHMVLRRDRTERTLRAALHARPIGIDSLLASHEQTLGQLLTEPVAAGREA